MSRLGYATVPDGGGESRRVGDPGPRRSARAVSQSKAGQRFTASKDGRMQHPPIGSGVCPIAPIAATSRGWVGHPPRCTACVAVAVTQLPSNSPRPIPLRSGPPRVPSGTSSAIMPSLGSRPSETQLASPSLPARRSARFRPPKNGRSSPSRHAPRPQSLPTPNDGGFYGGATSAWGRAGWFPTLTARHPPTCLTHCD
jgi:hypothetical protein